MKNIVNLNRIQGVANYQFDSNIGERFFPNEVDITVSKKTGRIRHVYLNGILIATFRPKDGFFSLTIAGARRLKSLLQPPRFRVVIRNDIIEFAKEGRNIFARHIITTDMEIRSGEEVMITDKKDRLLAVGKAVLTGKEMLFFKRGVAVKTRMGVDNSNFDS